MSGSKSKLGFYIPFNIQGRCLDILGDVTGFNKICKFDTVL